MAQVFVADDDDDDRGCSSGFVKQEMRKSSEINACLPKSDQGLKNGVEMVEAGKTAPPLLSCPVGYFGGEPGAAANDAAVIGVVKVPGMSNSPHHKAHRPPLVPSANRIYFPRTGPISTSNRVTEVGAAQPRNQTCPIVAVVRDSSAGAASGDGGHAKLGGVERKTDSANSSSGAVSVVQSELDQLRRQYAKVCAENDMLRQQFREQNGNEHSENVQSSGLEESHEHRHSKPQQRHRGEVRDTASSQVLVTVSGTAVASPCLCDGNRHEDQAGAIPDAELTSYLQRSQTLLHLALKDVPLIISHCDLDLRYTYVRFLHYPSQDICPKEILGKRDSELQGFIPGAMELADLKKEALSSGVPKRRELMIHSDNDAPKCLVLICEPALNAAGVTTGLTTLSMDVTDQVTVKDRLAQMGQEVASHEATEKELRGAIARADEAMEAKNNFLAVMSHEIRTPLNGVLGMAQVLATTNLDTEQKELVDAMVFSGDVLMAIISDILDLSKVESGTMDLEERELNPRDIVKHVVRTTIAVTRDRGVRIAADVCPDIPALVIGDPLRIKQVITNLVFNAVKFTKKGHVVVRMGLAKPNGEPCGEVNVKMSAQETCANVMQLGIIAEQGLSSGQDVDLAGDNDELGPTLKLDATWDPLLEGGRRDIAATDDEDPNLELSGMDQNQRAGISIVQDLHNLDQSLTSSSLLDNPEEKLIWLQCEVEDTGIGIPKESFPTLFQKFTQVHSSTTRKYGGTGLGLAICKRLVELMGGKIYVASEVGVGSKFTFTIRCKRPAAVSGVSRTMSVSETMLKANLSHTAARVQKLRAGMSIPSPPHRPSAASSYVDGSCNGQRTPLTEIFPGDPQKLLSPGSSPGQSHRAASLHERPGSWGGNEVGKLPLGLAAPAVPVASRTTENALKLGDTKANGLRRTSSGPPRIECSLLAAIEESKEVQIMSNATSGEKKILLAEDNKVNVMVAQSMLKRLGLVADVAYNGLEALKAIKRIHYDLVLMDICMPVMDGLEVTRRVRLFEETGNWDEELPATPVGVYNICGETFAKFSTGAESKGHCLMRGRRLPIVAMTANALLDCENKCSANGMDSFMTKPVTFKKLKDVLDGFLLTKTSSLPILGASACP